MKNMYECIVIGGGIAGASAAYHLAKRGYSVVLLERTTAAHHKVCGEFLSYEAMSLLKDMGISLDDNHSPVIKHFRWITASSEISFDFPIPARGVSRYWLDEALLKAALQAGAIIKRGVCVTNYTKTSENYFQIKTTVDELSARHLFVATGKHDCSTHHRRQGVDHSYLGLKVHVQWPKALREKYQEEMVFFSFQGGYGGISPVENETMNFCFIIDKKVYKSRGSEFFRILEWMGQSNPRLVPLLQAMIDHSPVQAIGQIPYGFVRRKNPEDGIYFLGDQWAVIPSLAGDGMAMALNTAKWCVETFDQNKQGFLVDSQSMQRQLRKQVRWALIGHWILKSRWRTGLCAAISRFHPFFLKMIFRKTRAGV